MFEKQKCQHQWKEVKRHSHDPVTRAIKGENLTIEIVQDLLCGFTIIEQACEHCGELKHYKIQGRI